MNQERFLIQPNQIFIQMEKQPVVKISLRASWLRVLVLFLLTLQILVPNKAWEVIFIGFGGLWLLTFIWSRQLAKGLRLQREQLYGWLQVGDWLEERFTLENQSWAPAVWVSIEDFSNLPGYSASMGTGIGSNSERHWKKRTPCNRRGEYQLGPLVLRTGDIFGIYSVEIWYPQSETFVVSPPVIHLPVDIQIVSGPRIDETRSTRMRTEKSVSSYSAREYLPGDSFAKIHWMITAKKDEPHVREFENIHASDSWWILLDMDSRVQVGKGDQATDEHSIIVAASLADHGLRSGKSIGLLASGEELVIHPARHGFGQRGEILRSLSLIQRGEQDLVDLISLSLRYLHQNSNVIVITSSTRLDWLDKLSQFRNKGITPSVMLVASDKDAHTDKLKITGRYLDKRGIDRYLFTAEIFDTPEARPGKHGEIKWKFTPMGRAIMIRSD